MLAFRLIFQYNLDRMETSSLPEQEQQREVLTVLSDLAKTHVAEPGGRLELLDIDPENIPGQVGYHVAGEPLPPRKVDTIAGLAEPRFPSILEAAGSEKAAPAMNETAEILQKGGNVIIVTNHGELTDIAFAEAALYSTIAKREIDFASAIIISKMVSMVGFKIVPDQPAVPAATALSWLCNDVYLTFPRTDSIQNSSIGQNMERIVSAHNTQVMSAVKKRLGEGGVMLAMAPSGTRDKMIKGTDKYGLDKVNRGTARIMQTEGSKVLPVAIWLKDKEPFFEICDKPREITSDDEAHEVMHDIADTLNSNLKHHRFAYLRDKARNFRNRY
jgi:hypothetical protein